MKAITRITQVFLTASFLLGTSSIFAQRTTAQASYRGQQRVRIEEEKKESSNTRHHHKNTKHHHNHHGNHHHGHHYNPHGDHHHGSNHHVIHEVHHYPQPVVHHNHHGHYGHHMACPSWGTYINVVPVGGYTIYHRNVNYTCVDGIFYKPHRSGFVIVGAPLGVRVSRIPHRHHIMRTAFSSSPYFYASGTFYQEVINIHGCREYVVVRPPMGSRVLSVPGCHISVRDRVYEIGGVYFKEVKFGRGIDDVCYEVINI